MAKHAERGEGHPPAQDSRVLDERHSILREYDASAIVGLKVIVCDGAIIGKDDDREETVELPKLGELMATAAIARCLVPLRLRGWEMKAMRKILGLTLTEFAQRLDERTAPETISRWETEAQPIGGYAEKLVRLVVCEGLRAKAPGVAYDGSMIAELRVVDPWRTSPDVEVPYIRLELVRMKEKSGSIIEAWDAKMAA